MPDDLIGLIQETHLKDALSERYLAYALSTIMSRSLPDVRDGLKPVHRRLIYAMHQLKLDPAAGFKKCARVVGDVMGKYHPHGDASIYDAMVRMAQDFAARYPLVEGQGNFGNIDGDNPAAMRYTEARLTAVAQAMLAGIDGTRWISGRPMTGRSRNRSFCRGRFRICWPMARRASRWAWRRPSRRTIWVSCAAR
jgi:topoisomerase-4 subunit A